MWPAPARRRWNLPIGGPSGARAEARRAEPATLESDDPQPATAGAAVSVEAVEAVEATQPARSGAPRASHTTRRRAAPRR
ncbi:MAG: hypothetical protein R2755_02110 [Acidimicrobiales bacterium]